MNHDCLWCGRTMHLHGPTGIWACDHCDAPCPVGADNGCSWCQSGAVMMRHQVELEHMFNEGDKE